MNDDRLVLQFLMTGGLTATRSEFEQLQSPSDLDKWLSTAFDCGEHTAATQEDFVRAIELREAIFLTIRAITLGQAPAAEQIDTINSVAALPPLSPVLRSDTTRRSWQRLLDHGAALATIARDAIDLLSGPTGGRVRECANPRCELVFVDSSPPGRRRWCAMDRCGNRSKTKAYRARQRR